MNQLDELEVDLSRQVLLGRRAGGVVIEYAISSAANGPGETMDSECTPRGRHEIVEKIGAGCRIDTVFVGRVPTGEIYRPDLRIEEPDRDWILTRILWLSGCEPGRNQGGALDSRARHIYIHGAPDDVKMGTPGSRGCIRMRNAEVIELFDRVETGTPVLIHE